MSAYPQVLAAGCRPFGCDCLSVDCPLCGSVDMALVNSLSQVASLLDALGALYDRNADWRDGVEEAAEYVRSLLAASDEERS